jgi:hypothetical protein
MLKTALTVSIAVSLMSAAALADVISGPTVGSKLPELKVAAVTGEFADQAVDYVAKREKKATVYVFVPASKWGRPTGRLIKKLDQEVTAADSDAVLVAVWLTDDVAKSKEYLPKAQQSIKFEHTALTVFDGAATGPNDWTIDPEADTTIVVARDGQVSATFGFVSPNETVAKDVLEALKKK